MSNEIRPVDIGGVLGFYPETGERYKPEPVARYETIEDLKRDPINWYALLNPEERMLFLISQKREMRQLPRHLRMFEEIYKEEQEWLQNADFIRIYVWPNECLDFNLYCWMVSNVGRVKLTKLGDLLQLVPPREAQLLEIVNRVDSGTRQTYGSSGTLQQVAHYIEKPIRGHATPSLYQEFLPRLD